MDQENDVLDYDSRNQEAFTTGTSTLDLKNRVQNKTPNGHRYKLLKSFSAQILLLVTFTINLSTLIGTFWIIFRLKLNLKDLDVISIEQSQFENKLLLKQDVLTNVLLLEDGLKFNEIIGDQIRVFGDSIGLSENRQAEIYLEEDTIYMKAKAFSSKQSKNGYSFKLANQVNIVDVPGGLKNIRVIRAPNTKRKNSVEIEGDNSKVDLKFLSPGGLDISGNMGLKVHSRQMQFDAPEMIKIESKDESFVIMAERGLYLPSIPFEDHNDISKSINYSNEPRFGHYDQTPIQEICISRDNGMIFQSVESCL